MKTYPSIYGPAKAPRAECIAFVKYDGSCLRFEFSKKRGWYKFGTRRLLFDLTHEFWGRAIPIFENTLAEGIEKAIQDNKDYRGVEHVTVFCEFFGPNSFAGQHVEEDKFELILFDVNPLKKGFVSPRNFVNHFGHLRYAAEVVYEGMLDQPFIEAIKAGVYPLQEGVVCKGGEGHKLWMNKIKTAAWIERVKAAYPETWSKFHDPKDEI